MNDMWSAIPIGTVPQRPRATGPRGAGPVVGRAAAPTPAPSAPAASDAPTTAVDEDSTRRLSAHALATRANGPVAGSNRIPPSAPTRVAPGAPTRVATAAPVSPRPLPAHPSASSSSRAVLPVVAAAALVAVAVAVLVPWAGSGPWVAEAPVGMTLLLGVAILTAPVTIDLLGGRDRSVVLLIGLPLLAAAAAGTVAVGGGDLGAVLTAQGLDSSASPAAGIVGAALVACLVVGVVGAVRRPHGTRRAVGAPVVVVAVCAGVIVAAVGALVIALGGPGPQAATVATAAGSTPTSTPAAGASPGAGAPTACPGEATATLPETAVGAPVVAHDARVHIAVCQGTSGALYYYGANDSTHLTTTLPATRSEDSWIAQHNGVTYAITPDHLSITNADGASIADEDLTGGWTG